MNDARPYTSADLRRLVSLTWRCPQITDRSAVDLMTEMLAEIAILEAPPEAWIEPAVRIPSEGRRP